VSKVAKKKRKDEYERPRWDRLYRKHFPHDTDPWSRHAKFISETLLSKRSEVRKLLEKAGYEPDHWANSIAITVANLWAERASLRRSAPKIACEP
jgi:hypothetical protein